MAAIKKDSDPLDNLSSQEIEDIVRSNEILDQENEKIIKEEEIGKRKQGRGSTRKRWFLDVLSAWLVPRPCSGQRQYHFL